MKTMVQYVHEEIKKKQVEIAVDFTMGNGHDTLLLSEIAKKVYSFDIQEEALLRTKELIHGTKHVTCILDNHLQFDKYLENFDLGIFNLGYLPNGNTSIVTNKETTLATLSKAIDKLNKKGTIYVVVYTGHLEGKQESVKIEEYVSHLHHRLYNVGVFKMLNKRDAPYVIEIEKR